MISGEWVTMGVSRNGIVGTRSLGGFVGVTYRCLIHTM